MSKGISNTINSGVSPGLEFTMAIKDEEFKMDSEKAEKNVGKYLRSAWNVQRPWLEKNSESNFDNAI